MFGGFPLHLQVLQQQTAKRQNTITGYGRGNGGSLSIGTFSSSNILLNTSINNFLPYFSINVLRVGTTPLISEFRGTTVCI